MLNWLFGNRCEHDFQIIDTLFDTYFDGDKQRYKTWRRYVLYCPKCDKEKRVDADDYDLKQKKINVKSRYNKLNT